MNLPGAHYQRAVSPASGATTCFPWPVLRQWWPCRRLLRKTAPKHGFPLPKRSSTYVDLGDSAALLVNDGNRRVKAVPVKRVLQTGIDKFPDQRQRIAALIRDLEEEALEDTNIFL